LLLIALHHGYPYCPLWAAIHNYPWPTFWGSDPTAYTEDRPALFAGLLGALKFFGGLPRFAVFDNPKTAVQRISRGRDRL
jgi:hypothetical protein